MSKNSKVSETKTTEKPETALAKTEPQGPSAALVKAQQVVALITSPSYFDESEAPDTGKKEEKTGGVPYLGFRGPKSTAKLDELNEAKVGPSEFYAYDGEVLKVQPLSLYLLKSAVFYTEQNNKMRITRAAFEAPPWPEPTKLRKYIVGVGVVRVPAGSGKVTFLPVGFQFRGGQCKAVERPIDLVAGASNKNIEAFKARSAKHAVAAGAVIAGGRLYATIWSTVQDAKTEDADGNLPEFNLGHNTIGYPDAAEVQAFNEWLPAAVNDPKAKLLGVLAQFEGRIDGLRRMARGEATALPEDGPQ